MTTARVQAWGRLEAAEHAVHRLTERSAPLPAAARLLRLGQPDMLGKDGLAGAWGSWLLPVADVLGAAGNALFANLPLLFALDAKFAIPGGFTYVPDCSDIARKSDAGGSGGDTYCGTSFSDGSHSGSSGDFGGAYSFSSGSDGGGDSSDGGSGDGGDSGCGGGGCGGGGGD